MIKGTFSLSDPDSAPATLTVTMTVGEWAQLQKELTDAYPAWRFGAMITDLIQHARQSFNEQVQTEAP